MASVPEAARPQMRVALELLTAWHDGGDFGLLAERLRELSDDDGGVDRAAVDGLVQLCGLLLTMYAADAGLDVGAALGLLGRYLA